jgi:transglutaminase-like putative cysteine protease
MKIPLLLFFALVLLIPVSLSQVAAQQNASVPGQSNFSTAAPFDSYSPFFYPDIRTPPQQSGYLEGNMFGSGGGGMPAIELLYIVTPSVPLVYWKDWSYDIYTGSGWSTSGQGSYSKTPDGPEAARFQVYRVVNPGTQEIALIKPDTPGSDVLESTFVPNGSVNYSISDDSYDDYMLSMNTTAEASFVYNATFYNVTGTGPVGDKSDIPSGIYHLDTQLPAEFPAELRQVAANLTDPSLNMLQQAEKTRDFVRNWVNYNLSWGSGGLPGPDDDIALWTYTHRQGICGHFATLFAVLLRAQGIPARVATGYAGGMPAGNYTLIMSSYAHAWTEVYIPPYGWIPMDATGTSNETANQSGNQSQQSQNQSGEMSLGVDWSDIGRTTLDLQYSLDQQTQPGLSQNQESELQKLNQSTNSSSLGGFNSSSFNWTGPMNGSDYNYSGLNYSLFNASGYNQSNLSYANQSSYNLTNLSINQTNLTQQNLSAENETAEQQKKQELEKMADEGLPGKLAAAIGSAISAVPPWLVLAVAAVIVVLLAVACLLRFRSGAALPKKSAAGDKAEIRRWVDIDDVIRKVKVMGAEGKKGEAVVYGYNELADYIAYILSVSNEPSLTAREFTNRALMQKKADERFMAANVPLLKTIVFIFEDSEYGRMVTDAQFADFVAALEKLAGK